MFHPLEICLALLKLSRDKIIPKVKHRIRCPAAKCLKTKCSASMTYSCHLFEISSAKAHRWIQCDEGMIVVGVSISMALSRDRGLQELVLEWILRCRVVHRRLLAALVPGFAQALIFPLCSSSFGDCPQVIPHCRRDYARTACFE